jgi:CheY-like chemotaxis protein
MEDTVSSQTIVAAVNDLMFGSRIRAAAQQAGVSAVFVRTAADLLERAATANLVLLDLETRWLDAPATISALKGATQTARVPVVVFGAHVDADALKAARDAGADRVLARSAFVKLLPELLRGDG